MKDEKQNRPYRNNNPGNIKIPKGGIDSALARYGDAGLLTDPVESKDGGYFLKFSSPEAGFAAIPKLLKAPDGGYLNLTVEQAARTWSNNAYGSTVAPHIPGNKLIKDLSDSETQELAEGIAHREGWNSPLFKSRAVDRGEAKLAPIYEAIGQAINDPIYTYGTPGYQRDVRSRLYDTRVSPFFIQKGLTPPDKEAFIENGQWMGGALKPGAGKDEPWLKTAYAGFLSATLKNVRGLAIDVPHTVDSILQHGQATWKSENDKFVQAHKAIDFPISVLDTWLDNHDSHTFKSWSANMAGTGLADLPLFWASGGASEAIAGRIAANGVSKFLTKRAVDFSEGYLYGLLKEDENPLYSGAGFAVGNTAFEFMGKLISNVGLKNFNESMSQTVIQSKKFTEEESRIVDTINEIMKWRRTQGRRLQGSYEGIRYGNQGITPREGFLTGERIGDRKFLIGDVEGQYRTRTGAIISTPSSIESSFVPQRLLDRLSIGTKEFSTVVETIRAQARAANEKLTPGMIPRELLYANYTLLNSVTKDVLGENAPSFHFLKPAQKARVLTQVGKLSGEAHSLSPIYNREGLRAVVAKGMTDVARQRPQLIPVLTGGSASPVGLQDAIEQATEDARATTIQGTLPAPEAIAEALTKTNESLTKFGPGAAAANDPNFLNPVYETLGRYLKENSNMTLEGRRNKLIFLWGLKDMLPKNISTKVQQQLENASKNETIKGLKGTTPTEWTNLSQKLDRHMQKLVATGRAKAVNKHGITRVFNSSNFAGEPTTWQKELDDIYKRMGGREDISDLGNSLQRSIKNILHIETPVETNPEKIAGLDKLLDTYKDKSRVLEKETDNARDTYIQSGLKDKNAYKVYGDKLREAVNLDVEIRKLNLEKLKYQDVGEVRKNARGQVTVWVQPHFMRIMSSMVFGGEGTVAFNSSMIPIILTRIEQARGVEKSIKEKLSNLLMKGFTASRQAGQKTVTVMGHEARPVDAVKTLREERIHAWQSELGRGLMNEHLDLDGMLKVMDTIKDSALHYLKKSGYNLSGENAGHLAVAEVMAKLGSGLHEDMGYTREEALRTLVNYFKEIKRVHGVNAANALGFANKIAREAARVVEKGEEI
jgi:hypothetical protein